MIYTNQNDKPGRGWGAQTGNGELGSVASSAVTIDPGRPSLGKNHNQLDTLSMRLYFDQANPALRRRLGPDAYWTSFHDRVAVDVLVTEDAGEGEYTVLATTRKPDHISLFLRPALQDLLTSDDHKDGSIKPIKVSEELDPDLFLWLVYREHAGLKLTDDLVLDTIEGVDTRPGFGWKSKYSGGATFERGDILANVAASAEFGPARVDVAHFGDPAGSFAVKLEMDGGFLVYRATRYDDDELTKELSPEALGKRHVEDIWQVLLPKIRNAHAGDDDWRDTLREEFRQDAKAQLRRI